MINNRFACFIHNQINRLHEGGVLLLVRNIFILLIMPFLLLLVLLTRFLRPLIFIRFGELISSRIGHFAANTEVYLCERDLNIHRKKDLDIFYINSSVCNKQLMRMWERVLCICPFAKGLDWANRLLPGGGKQTIQWRADQDRDIYGTLESTAAHISFTDKEEHIGQSLIGNMGITSGSPFVCFHSRSSDYLGAMFPKGNWHYHDYRDSNINNFICAAEQLTRRGYFALRMGSVVKESLEIANPKIIDYSIRHRSDFLDIFLGAKCHFYLGNPSGYICIPMIFRRPLAIVNMIPLEYALTWGSDYLFVPKKLRLIRENRLLSFQEILGSDIGRFCHSQQYEQSGIEAIENTPEEITALAIEMDLRLKGEWQVSDGDEELQQRFWALFKPSELNRVFRARIGAEFLRQNKALLE